MSKKIVSSGSAYNVTEVQNAETILNKTTTLSSSSTDTEYASAKATYDAIQAGSGGATDLNAVHYTADTGKTEEQKTQARTNIGAGTYDKPDGGIPSTDMTSAVQTSLGKADTSIQQHDEYAQDITVGTTGGTAHDTALNIGTNADDAYISFGTKSTSRGKLGVSKNNEPLFYNYYTGQRKIIATTDQLTDKEDTSNKTTVISAESTDTQYPTAKATYDGLSEKYTKPDGGIPSTDLAEAYLPLTAGDTKKLTGTLYEEQITNEETTFIDLSAKANYHTQLRCHGTSGYGQWTSLVAYIDGWRYTYPVNILSWGGIRANLISLGDDSAEGMIDGKLLTLRTAGSNYLLLKSKYIMAGDAWTSTILYPGAPDGSTTYKSYLGCDSSIDASKGNHYWICTYTDAIKMKINDTRQDLATYLGTKEDTSNKVTTITSSSTDTQYPSAKLVYDTAQTLQTEINNLKSIGRFLAILDASNGTVSSQPSGSVGDSYSYKVGDYYRVGTAGTYAPKSTATYIIDETSGSSNFEQGAVSYGIGDLIYCSNLTETTSTWVKQQSSGGGTVQDVQVNGTSILSGGIANITSGNLPSHTHTLANITDVSATATEINYLSGTTSNVQTQLDSKGTYSKPDGGIPSTDMTSAVQTSLGLADTAVQPAALDSYLPLTAGENKKLTAGLYIKFPYQSSMTQAITIADTDSYPGANNPWYILKGYSQNDKHVVQSWCHNRPLVTWDSAASEMNICTQNAGTWNSIMKIGGAVVIVGHQASFNNVLWPNSSGGGSIGGYQSSYGALPNFRAWGSAYINTIYTTINGTTNSNLTTHLAAVDTSIQAKEDTSNKVTSISASSTDTQYPSAKLVYDQLATKQSTLTVNPATTSASLTSIGINGTNYALAGGTQVIWRTY